METCIDYLDETAWVSTDERKTINRIMRLMEQYPGEVKVIKKPEENHGMLYCTIPSKWVRIAPPRKVELTDEERAEIGNRLKMQRTVHQTGAEESDGT